MTHVTGHCRGCNQDFPADKSARCPQCGEELTVACGNATLDLDETLPGGSLPNQVPVPNELSLRLAGSRLGNYDIQRFLGSGGMALVFQARHLMLERLCAVKILRPDIEQRSRHSVELFLREARSAASLVHPHIVAVHNIGHIEELHLIEMEFVPGQSLQGLLNSRRVFAALEATDYLVQTCSALAAAHDHGLVHRDFKPANILIRPDGLAKLADFGLAKQITPPGRTGGQPEQALAGTPYYMAPELFRGAPGSRASDVYAAGVSYYYLLTGHFPFQDRHIARLAHLHETAPVPDPREVNDQIPAASAELIRRAMHKVPQERFADGGEIHQQLLALFTQLRSLRSIVQEATTGLPAELLDRDDEVLEVLVTLNQGRTQRIYIHEAHSEAWPARTVRVFSICAPAVTGYYERALQLNAQIPHGSLAIEEVGGIPHFVMLNNYLRSRCDPLEIRHSIMDIAQWADDIELALTGKDLF